MIDPEDFGIRNRKPAADAAEIYKQKKEEELGFVQNEPASVWTMIIRFFLFVTLMFIKEKLTD